MIYQRLSDHERTLLSAFLDGEVSAMERRTAEELLSGSEEARAYLREIRAVNNLSVEAFPPLLADAVGTLGSSFSGSGISTAAQKTSMLNGLFSSTWGVAGVAASAAAIVAAVSLSGDQPRTGNPTASKPVAVHEQNTPSTAPFDTSHLIVPAMTPAELVGFAVQGTLPIDAGRDRFLTVRTKGEDSFAINVRNGVPVEVREPFQGITLGSSSGLDTVQRAIRSSVKALKDGGIALRRDFMWQRHRLIDYLQNRRVLLPADLQAPLRQARRTLESSRVAATFPTFNRPVRAVDAGGKGEGHNPNLGFIQVGEDQSFDVLIINGNVQKLEGDNVQYNVPCRAFAPRDVNKSTFMLGPSGMKIDPKSFDLAHLMSPSVAEVQMIAPVPVPDEEFGVETLPEEVDIFAAHARNVRENQIGAGDRAPKPVGALPVVQPVQHQVLPADGDDQRKIYQQYQQLDPEQLKQMQDYGLRYYDNDMQMEGISLQEVLQQVDRELRKADSIINGMREQVRQGSVRKSRDSRSGGSRMSSGQNSLEISTDSGATEIKINAGDGRP